MSTKKEGITTYIRRVLQRGIKFNIGYIPNESTHPKYGIVGPDLGLKIGRVTHNLLSNETRLNPYDPWHTRAANIRCYLAHKRIQIVQRECDLSHAQLPLKVRVDAIGKDCHNQYYIIEYKTTQYSIAHHTLSFFKSCKNPTQLLNGLANNQYTTYALQVGFAMLCYGKNVKGLIIVAAEDGIKDYCVPSSFTRPQLFPLVSTARTTTVAKFQRLTSRNTTMVETVLHPYVITRRATSNLIYGSYNKRHIVVGLIGKIWSTIHKKLQEDYIRLIKRAIGRKKHTEGYIMYLQDRQFVKVKVC